MYKKPLHLLFVIHILPNISFSTAKDKKLDILAPKVMNIFIEIIYIVVCFNTRATLHGTDFSYHNSYSTPTVHNVSQNVFEK